MESYTEKFARYKNQTLYPYLDETDQAVVRQLAVQYRLTFQEIRQLAEYARDLAMWQEKGIGQWLQSVPELADANKRQFLSRLHQHMDGYKSAAKIYPAENLPVTEHQQKPRIINAVSDKNVFGDCPVASPRTICCNLKTIDAVESCVFGCSYCTIQTFYQSDILIDKQLAEKLDRLQLDPNRLYHIGTGQSSDSLAFGNRDEMLDTLCAFARTHTNVILELKTKSDNIGYFLQNDIPGNVICSWSLNPQTIIDHEEHFTASLDRRLQAARLVADRGIKAAFHFHPIIYYRDWEDAYPGIARVIMQSFAPHEIVFISFGSVTFIKPVLKKIRQLGLPTKITQMKFVTDPHGKLTYPDEIKIRQFRTMYQTFAPWHKHVFFYLCMEKASIWQNSLGWVFPDNETFEQTLIRESMAKMNLRDGSAFGRNPID